MIYNDWMGDCTSWEPVLPFLDVDRFTYARTDVRGYGRSIGLSGEYHEKEAAADTLELTEYLDWNRFHLVGFSMTSMVVERLASALTGMHYRCKLMHMRITLNIDDKLLEKAARLAGYYRKNRAGSKGAGGSRCA